MSTTTTRSALQIRREFLDFFTKRHAHVHVPSSPVVPHDDPTLLFANAGMNQFKDIFLGHADGVVSAGNTRRVVNSQKCIRAGGKHNDLEDVGRDTYHHTFFEMLGNWSFGDYFKEEAIAWAWELLTEVWGLEADRLFVTVFAGDPADGLEADEEAETIWARHIDADRISRWGRADNFWEMGETGPCGPCSEIHYDFTPDRSGRDLVNRSHPDVIEIWNLVFIQFNRGDDKRLTPLPAAHVDTGMGFERIVRVLQGKRSNYDTDIWSGIFAAIAGLTGAAPYQGRLDDPVDMAYRVIADHIRCLTVAMNDGAAPSNEGRGYVLRRILRRAVRHAHQTLGVEGPLLCDLVPAVVESLGNAFPELREKPDRIAATIRDEEESFLRTLDRGLELFADAAARAAAATGATGATGGNRGVISAADAFRLHDTYGFPIDLTRVMAEEQGIGLDEAGYEHAMAEARDRSRQGTSSAKQLTLPPDALAKLRHLGIDATDDEPKYGGRPVVGHVRAIWNGTDFDESAHVGDEVAVILDRTPFYAEAGGQVGDTGALRAENVNGGTLPIRGRTGTAPHDVCHFKVEDTQRVGDFVLHVGRVTDGRLACGTPVQAMIDRERRRATMANHTATHLLNHALRAVLAGDVDQRGSYVGPDKLRFDFTAASPLSLEQLTEVESRVNAAIAAGLRVDAAPVALETGRQINGLRAVFGERYP
ncbi:MAG: alanine--tRNA ligase, partial [Phycisphaerales bacterium]|nr:alanine--tRNA ligase [Phycisphaerales bacterium]